MSLKKRLKSRWFTWVDRRVPLQDSHELGRRNLYIFLSREGFLFGILLIVMLLTGINYQNSLVFLLTFLLGAIFFMAISQTHNNLAGLRFSLVDPGEGFVGQSMPLAFRLTQSGDRLRPGLAITTPDGQFRELELESSDAKEVVLGVTAQKRGHVDLPRIRVESRYPFGLLKAWGWIRFASRGLAYPKPLEPPFSPVGRSEDGDEQQRQRSASLEEMTIRPYRTGDSLARVQWKRFARSGDMVVMDWEGPQGNPQWLDFDAYAGADAELRLSYLAYAVEQLSQTGAPFGLKLPGVTIDIASGSSHRRECLRQLALWGHPK